MGLSQEDQASFKKRMQGCILATDMSRHDSDLNEMKAIMDSVPEGTN